MDCEILQLAQQGLKYEAISNILQTRYPGKKGTSLWSVLRALKKQGYKRNKLISDQALSAHVARATYVLGPQTGRRFVHGYIKGTAAHTASEARVGAELKRLDPENHTRRETNAHQRLNPVPYRASYFGHRIHLDQNEKLVRFGCTLVAAIDGYSGYVASCDVMPVKNNLVIYQNVYKYAVEKHGLWDQVVVDCGKEFYLTLAVQEALAERRTNTAIASYRQVKSTVNNRIERFWPEVNQRILYPIKNIMNELEEKGVFDLSSRNDQFFCSLLTRHLVRPCLKEYIIARNHRCASGRGVPSVLMTYNHAAAVGPLPDANLLVPIQISSPMTKNASSKRLKFVKSGNSPLAFGTNKISRYVPIDLSIIVVGTF